MTPPLTHEQKQLVRHYARTLGDIVFAATQRYHQELESRGVPVDHIPGRLTAALYGAAEQYLRLGGAEDFAKALHNAVQ